MPALQQHRQQYRPRPRAPVGRRDLLAALGLALSGLLLAACPRQDRRGDPPARQSGGSMRRY
jgi:hypothetical protein